MRRILKYSISYGTIIHMLAEILRLTSLLYLHQIELVEPQQLILESSRLTALFLEYQAGLVRRFDLLPAAIRMPPARTRGASVASALNYTTMGDFDRTLVHFRFRA